MRNKRKSRQLTVLRSLFRTLHPILESGLAPARRLLTTSQKESGEQSSSDTPDTSYTPRPGAAAPNRAERSDTLKTPLVRTLTDEHLVLELENITRQISRHGHTAHTQPGRRASPQRGARHYSRDTLLALLEEAKVRIQVLETELELARGHDETIPMLTEEWTDEWLEEALSQEALSHDAIPKTGKPKQQK